MKKDLKLLIISFILLGICVLIYIIITEKQIKTLENNWDELKWYIDNQLEYNCYPGLYNDGLVNIRDKMEKIEYEYNNN